jgi:hypothetical protein
MQIGLPAEQCFPYFFGLIRDCYGITSRENSWRSWLVLASDLAIMLAITIGGYFLVRQIRNRKKLLST